MKKIVLVVTSVIMFVFVLGFEVTQAGTIPTISIEAVTKDEKVTILTHQFPPDKDFKARMGLIGTKGVDGILAGIVNSGEGGSLKFTFKIPAALNSEDLIAIRLESTSGGYFSYNWFTNVTFGDHTGGKVADEPERMPSINVVSVKKDAQVTVKGIDFAEDETFDVLMGEENTKGIDGAIVDTITSGEDMSFQEVFEIPESMKGKEKIAIRFESQETDLVVYAIFKNETGACGGTTTDNGGAYTGTPTISIMSVEEDKSVTIKMQNFPKDKIFKVLMGKMGTKGINGIEVTTINSLEGGSFEKTFDIPESLEGEYQIAIRLQTDDGYFFAYNWFYNHTTKPGTVTPSGYTGIPTFIIDSVEMDESVTIMTDNFPANITFRVLMGKMGTKGVSGIQITTIDSESGGTFEKTFNIPEDLKGEKQLAIRLEAETGGYYAYNWFYNNTTDADGGSHGYTGIPSFVITGVKQDSSVTIKTTNFPANYDFEVLMGAMGTRGIGGIIVTKIDSNAGGEFTKSFDIPASLAGSHQIAIRLQSTTGGFYAYNWFNNTTYP